ncbi:MAG: biopolymer transporter ExbD [Fusobacterium perfoetens]|uniref:ExbD/TolR family protein n=1 Tax=Fusobacterium perfoetens TaxID=852 RepID=UPI0023F10C78|nr:biopolymer transporter ExbD [Fusobacterium perfoetens]MCI6153156.1 biopolymer transporter ExbD [Fusobacterium perfoetens]MDY3237086.1 biopolymer transporter ExbD [Fusobacterium perfoetens]
MGKYRKNKNILAVDLTPLIDVVFLLLIFFMVTTTFDKYGQIDIDIPTANVESPDKKLPLEIIIDKKGDYFAIKDGKTFPIDIDNLGNILIGIDSVSVTADKELKYQIVMDTITKIKKQGIENLGINFYE